MRTFRTVTCSVTGYRKKKENLACEDAAKAIHVKEGTVIAVADGHGDKRCLFAAEGARLATAAACGVLKKHLKSVRGSAAEYWNDRRKQIAQEIVQRFAQLVVADYQHRGREQLSAHETAELQSHIRSFFEKNDGSYTAEQLRDMYVEKKRLSDRLYRILFLYGTTVRASVLTDTYVFSCALGDGDTVAVIDGSAEWLLPPGLAFECETDSLSESMETSAEAFMFSFIERRTNAASHGNAWDARADISAVMLSTDGLRNAFFSDDLFKSKVKILAEALSADNGRGMTAKLKKLYRKLSMESVFQDDITGVFAIPLPPDADLQK